MKKYTFPGSELLTHTILLEALSVGAAAEVSCTKDEWEASQAKKGQTCWFRFHKGDFMNKGTLSAWTRGSYSGSFYYDGVSILVYEDDPDDRIEHRLLPGLYLNDPERRERFTLTKPE